MRRAGHVDQRRGRSWGRTCLFLLVTGVLPLEHCDVGAQAIQVPGALIAVVLSATRLWIVVAALERAEAREELLTLDLRSGL